MPPTIETPPALTEAEANEARLEIERLVPSVQQPGLAVMVFLRWGSDALAMLSDGKTAEEVHRAMSMREAARIITRHNAAATLRRKAEAEAAMEAANREALAKAGIQPEQE